MPRNWRSMRFRLRCVTLNSNFRFMPDHSPRRIASLQPSATVILAEIGELDRVVACTKYCADVVEEITSRKRTILADSWTASAEHIIAVHPDLVIAAVPYQ